jgi:phenylalanyl-tRNA synthetase beta chain
MKTLLSWLKEYAPEIDGDPFALGDLMSDIGLTCEEVVLVGRGLEGVVVAKVLDLRPHPDADRIQLVDVDRGDGEALQVCCGAFNMAVGDLVPLATIGTTMPNGMEIARRKLRGEWSNGMLCSGRELELGDDHSGILVLPPGLPLGTPFAEAMQIESDVLFDLDLTPNRPDALSVIGVARDVAAKLGVPFSLPDIDVPTSGPSAGELATITVLDPDLCGRFTARVLSGLTVGPSPDLIARRLTLMGMRPISSVVDLSNYVMLEYGQPNHTYDLGVVRGAALRVRMAREGEELETLDGQARRLVAADGVIADGDDIPIGLAGVMGGASTEISADTTDVLLELAWWDPATIARSSKVHGLRSEASIRFEKGVDPEIASRAAARFAQLASEQGATVHPGEIVVEGNLPPREPVLLRTARVERILGTAVPVETMRASLDPIGFTTTAEGDDLRVELPSWRPDATAEIDVIEEVARMYGYERLGRTVPSSPYVGSLTRPQQDRRTIGETLAANGLLEVWPMAFLAPGELERSGVRTDGVVVANPLVAEESVLRTSLLPGLLATLGYNAAHRETGLGVFQLGHCYAMPAAGETMPAEWEELGIAVGGADAVAAVETARVVIESLGLPEPTITSAEIAGLHPTRSATVSVGGERVGEVGEVDPAVATDHGVAERVAWVRIDLDELLSIDRPLAQASAVSRFPTADIDLAFVVDDDLPAHEIAADLRRGHELVRDVRLFDVYRGDQVGDDRRSLAFAVRLQADDRTLTDSEVAAARDVLIERVVTHRPATLRT